jgi:hypothetical protein
MPDRLIVENGVDIFPGWFQNHDEEAGTKRNETNRDTEIERETQIVLPSSTLHPSLPIRFDEARGR